MDNGYTGRNSDDEQGAVRMLIALLQMPLLTAVSAMLIAQLVKVPIYWFFNQKFDAGLMFSTGGMPSSHSAMVTGVTTNIGLSNGVDSDLFGLAAVIALIVMYDALGIRRQAGKQATILNQLVKEMQHIGSLIADAKHRLDTKQQLKELLGHEPLEVFFGALLGVIVAVAIDAL